MMVYDIAVVDQTQSVRLPVSISALIAANQKYADRYLRPAWGVACKLRQAATIVDGAWNMVFLDNADVANALGYHDLSPTGLPFSRIFTETAQKYGEDVAVTFSHELGEMLVDPFCQEMMMHLETGDVYPLEIADAVEEDTFGIDGIGVSNFVLPAWFESWHAPGSRRFDLLGALKKPFELRPGGYASILRSGDFMDIFGSNAKAERFAKEDRRQHRMEFWKRNVADVVLSGCVESARRSLQGEA
jgi:hypothetical protein